MRVACAMLQIFDAAVIRHVVYAQLSCLPYPADVDPPRLLLMPLSFPRGADVRVILPNRPFDDLSIYDRRGARRYFCEVRAAICCEHACARVIRDYRSKK